MTKLLWDDTEPRTAGGVTMTAYRWLAFCYREGVASGCEKIVGGVLVLFGRSGGEPLKGGISVPQGEISAVQGDNSTLHSENPTLHRDNSTLHGENTTLHSGNATRHGENSTLYSDNSTLHRENAIRQRGFELHWTM